MENKARKKPTVFVSSTCYDLKQIRADIKDFFEDTYGFEAILSEFNSFPVDPAIGTCDNCLNNVDTYADFFILIIGNRYGYITDKGKSITNLEYLHAKAKGIPLFIFVDKDLYTIWRMWQNNKDGDYSAQVDTPKIFDFISDIYDGAQQWVYTYDNVKDITTTMKNQLGLIFSDGLAFKNLTSSPETSVINGNLCPAAVRTLVEKPFMWEYKFLAHTLKSDFDFLKKDRWNLKYGFFDGHTISLEPMAFLDKISDKLEEIIKITELINILINNTIPDSIGEPGVPSDLEMMVYASKQFSDLYRKIVEWALYFKTIKADPLFDNLLKLLYELPSTPLKQLDDFVDDIYAQIISIPDTEIKIEKTIKLHCSLDTGNTGEVNAEIARIAPLLKAKFLIND